LLLRIQPGSPTKSNNYIEFLSLAQETAKGMAWAGFDYAAPVAEGRHSLSHWLQFWSDKSRMSRDGAMYSAIGQKPANLIRLMS
jgi:hypothetical protein